MTNQVDLSQESKVDLMSDNQAKIFYHANRLKKKSNYDNINELGNI